MNQDTPGGQPAVQDSPNGASDRLFLASFALASAAGLTGLGRLYTKHKTSGIIRLCLFAISMGLLVIALINGITKSGPIVALAILLIAALTIWMIVDMIVLLTGKHKDAANGQLQEFDGEKKIATVFLSVPIVISVSLLLLLVLPIALTPSVGPYDGLAERYIKLTIPKSEAFQAYDKIVAGTTNEQLKNYLGSPVDCKDDMRCFYQIRDEATHGSEQLFSIEVSVRGGVVQSKNISDSTGYIERLGTSNEIDYDQFMEGYYDKK